MVISPKSIILFGYSYISP